MHVDRIIGRKCPGMCLLRDYLKPTTTKNSCTTHILLVFLFVVIYKNCVYFECFFLWDVFAQNSISGLIRIIIFLNMAF